VIAAARTCWRSSSCCPTGRCDHRADPSSSLLDRGLPAAPWACSNLPGMWGRWLRHNLSLRVRPRGSADEDHPGDLVALPAAYYHPPGTGSVGGGSSCWLVLTTQMLQPTR